MLFLFRGVMPVTLLLGLHHVYNLCLFTVIRDSYLKQHLIKGSFSFMKKKTYFPSTYLPHFHEIFQVKKGNNSFKSDPFKMLYPHAIFYMVIMYTCKDLKCRSCAYKFLCWTEWKKMIRLPQKRHK